MKRVISWILVVVLCLGLFAGCKKNETGPEVDVSQLQAALEYVKTVYKNVGEKTPKDYQRIGNVPVNGVDYEVVWTANVGEEHIKVVKGTDGMVTIDVNENEPEDVKYELTATVAKDGVSVSHTWKHLLPAANGDMVSIVEDAYALEAGASLDYEATLKGKITAINTAWSEDYKNITVTIVVEGAEDKPIQCYRLQGEGAKDLKIGDIITVTGTLKNYNGTIEFDAGCTLDAVVAGEAVEAPEDPKQIVKDAYALAENGALAYEATLTGKITKINSSFSDVYNNVTVTMVIEGMEDYPIQCFRLSGKGADKIGEGDTITVTGYIINYKGTVQFNAGCTLDSWKDTGSKDPESAKKDNFVNTMVTTMITEPEEGVAYKFYMNQKNRNEILYLTGEMDGYYMATTKDPSKAVDVYYEEVSGGCHIYFMKGGVKTYLAMEKSGTHNNAVFKTSAYTLKWNSTINGPTGKLDEDMYFGTYSKYYTFGASPLAYVTGEDADNLDTSNFVGHLGIVEEKAVEKESAASQAYAQLKADYFTESEVTVTGQDYTRKNVYTYDDEDVEVVWTADSDAVTIVDNGDGTVTVKVTQDSEEIAYTLTATITDGDEKLTASWECVIPVKPVTVADGTYILYVQSEESVMDALAASKNYGYPSAVEVTKQGETLVGFTAAALYTVKNGEDQTLRLVDSNGRYLYMSGTYNSFNLSVDAPETGADWALEEVGDGTFYIRNVENNKYIALDTNYGSFGAYTDQKSVITLKAMKAEDVVITAAMAAAAMEAEYADGFEAGSTLAGTYTYEGTEFTVTWAVDPADSVAVKIEEGKLVMEPQDEKVPFTLTATVSKDEDEAVATFEGEVPANAVKYYVPKVVEAPETGVAYKFYMHQGNLEKDLYFTGAMDGNYLATSENATDAVSVYLEAVENVENGYRFYFYDADDVKQYIAIVNNGSDWAKVTIATEVEEYFVYDAERAGYFTQIAENKFNIGTAGNRTYTTMSACGDGYFATNFNAQFVTLAPALQDVEEAEPPVAFDTAYKFFMYQGNLEKTLYFTGAMDGNYLATSGELSDAVDVYVEDVSAATAVENSVRFYFYDADDVKQYVAIVNNGSDWAKVTIATEVEEYFVYDAERAGYFTQIAENKFNIGTAGNRTYTTMSACGDGYFATNFNAQFGTVVVKEVAPAAVAAPEAGTAYKFHMHQGNLEKDLYFTGAMDGNYLATSEDFTEAVDVYLEAVENVENGYRFYFYDADDVKQYIAIVNNGSDWAKVTIATEVEEYFVYDAERDGYFTQIAENKFNIGTAGNRTYTTMSACGDGYFATNFNAQFVTIEFVEDITPAA